MKPTKQARRFRRLAKIIETKPDNFHMGSWFNGKGGSASTPGELPFIEDDLLHPADVTDDPKEFLASLGKGKKPLSCGMTACIGGWTLIRWPDEVDPNESIEMNARRILGLTNWDDVGDLFSSSADWQTAADAAAELRRRATEIEESIA